MVKVLTARCVFARKYLGMASLSTNIFDFVSLTKSSPPPRARGLHPIKDTSTSTVLRVFVKRFANDTLSFLSWNIEGGGRGRGQPIKSDHERSKHTRIDTWAVGAYVRTTLFVSPGAPPPDLCSLRVLPKSSKTGRKRIRIYRQLTFPICEDCFTLHASLVLVNGCCDTSCNASLVCVGTQRMTRPA